MNKLCIFFAAAFLVALATPRAHAAIVFTFDPNASRVVNGNLATYTLSFTATGLGEQIFGFAGNFAGNNAFSGPMSQQLAAGTLPTPNQRFNHLIDESLDSQFLLTDSQILSAVAPFESDATLGWAGVLAVSARAQTKALVQIVANVHDVIAYNFGISPGFEGETTNFTGVLGVPEPSSLALAAAGVLAALASRPRVRAL
jgi:hypothetical protein